MLTLADARTGKAAWTSCALTQVAGLPRCRLLFLSVAACSEAMPSADGDKLAQPLRRCNTHTLLANVSMRCRPWMDVNVVVPTGRNTCEVRFDWWVKREHAGNAAFVDASIASSLKVQEEDIALCESVQRGLESPGFSSGRYAPSLEQTMFHFHQMLHERYTQPSE